MGVVPETWLNVGERSRGQAFPIDALVGLFILLGAATVIILATGVSPQEASQPQAQVFDGEVESEVEAALIASDHDGSLKRTVLSWDDSQGEFRDGVTPTVRQGWFVEHPNTEFGDRLTWIEASHGVSINVRLVPGSNASAPDSTPEPMTMIETVTGEGDRVIERKTIVIDEKDRLQSPAAAHSSSATPTVGTAGDGVFVGSAGSYPIPEGASPHGDGRLYNTVTVEVVIYDV